MVHFFGNDTRALPNGHHTMSSALLSLLLAVLSADLSVQEEIVPQTVFAASATVGPDLSPKPTAFNLTKRADHIPPNICGWFSGSGYGLYSLLAT